MNLLFEILSEEIPARMQCAAADEIAQQFKVKFEELSGQEIQIESWVTPRRIGFYAQNLIAVISQKSEEFRGPKVSAPDAALAGFLGKYQVTKDQLEAKGDYYFYTKIHHQLEAKSAVKEVIEQLLKNYTWPKSMAYGLDGARWVRPIHSIICLLDNNIVPVAFNGVIASNHTMGHRFMSNAKLDILNFEDYKAKLAHNNVMLTHSERETNILEQATKLSQQYGLTLVEDASLVAEVAGLVEKPFVLLGEIDANFMMLPEEVLIITLRHHQRYMMLRNADGTLASKYLIISNIDSVDGGAEIIRGNSKVLRARLSDAKFFFEQDCKATLASRIDELKKLTFHTDIGSIFDKVQSNIAMALKIANLIGANTNDVQLAAEIAKCDLVTNMVKEFPELQGVMGYYYALNDGINKEIALAIRDQYRPQGPSDMVPANLLGAVIALADKLQTLQQMFAINIKPTGSKDPYALRRAAIGILRIIEEKNINLDLKALDLRDDVLEFLSKKS